LKVKKKEKDNAETLRALRIRGEVGLAGLKPGAYTRKRDAPV